MASPFIAQVNLVFQAIILATLVVSIMIKKRRNYSLHGITMLIAVILNAFSFMLVMGPSLLSLGQLIVDKPLNLVSMATMAHAFLGSAAEILAIWVIVSWRFRSPAKYCARKKKTMRVTWLLWLIALLSGFSLYALLYVI